jgi:hypothetical protein
VLFFAQGGSPAARRKAECISEAMLSLSFQMQKIQTTLLLIAVLFGFFVFISITA